MRCRSVYESSERCATPRLTLLAAVLAWCVMPPTIRADEQLLASAAKAASDGQHERAVELLSQVIAADAKQADAYYLRGRSRFCLGQAAEAVADFDRYVDLRPRLASQQWERGIACYYAGEFQKGAEQFELYQTYHDNDVENSVWRYLCLVPSVGVDEARKTMLPIRDDRRIPMMQIYHLYRGELTVEEVFAALEKDKPSEEVKAGRLFYAQLYLGLYYESLGEQELAKKYVLQAADDHRDTKNINRYMWSVADVHARRYR